MLEIISLKNSKKLSLTGNQLKFIAVITMILDHFTWAFVATNSVMGVLFHFLGRFTAPMMCFFIAEGYHHTSDVKKYLTRLGIFAVISHFTFNLFANYGSKLTFAPTSVIFTLFCGLAALQVYYHISNKTLKWLLILGLTCITFIADWGVYGVIFILIFGLFHENRNYQILFFSITVLADILISGLSAGEFHLYRILSSLGMFLILPALFLYQGERGRKNRFQKWFFYIVYPVQFIVIGLFYVLFG